MFGWNTNQGERLPRGYKRYVTEVKKQAKELVNRSTLPNVSLYNLTCALRVCFGPFVNAVNTGENKKRLVFSTLCDRVVTVEGYIDITEYDYNNFDAKLSSTCNVSWYENGVQKVINNYKW